MLGEVLAEVTRSGIVESVHAGHLVLLNADGSILFQKGDPTLNIYSRSSLKSIQASAMVRAGLDIEPRLLALVCASHAGTPMHQQGALAILAKAGLDEHSLKLLLIKSDLPPFQGQLSLLGDHVQSNEDLADSMKYRENRYAMFGNVAQRISVTFSWMGISFGEIRDLNRHRTGNRFTSLVPIGFYDAVDQLEGITNISCEVILNSSSATVSER